MILLWLAVVAATVAATAAAAGQHDHYSGYTVYGVRVATRADTDLLHQLEVELSADVIRHGVAESSDALVMLAPEQREIFLEKLDQKRVTHYLKVPDVAAELYAFDEDLAKYRRDRAGKLYPYEDYPRHAEVDTYLETIAAQHPDIVTLVTAGPSFEGRSIKYLKISTTNFTDTSKPIYYMDAMIHAREWVTTPVALYAIHRLVEDLRDEDQDLLQNIDWIIHPIVNPDGYEFTHTDFRLWRRTRSDYALESSGCYGVDANRNFDVSFNTVGVSANPCSDVYPGITAFSEIETTYVRDILLEHVNRTQIYMNIHSHGNWVLYGYGNSSLPGNAVALHHVGAAMGAAIDALKLPAADFYKVGNSAFLLYATSGSAQDYGQVLGVPFSFTLELPGYNYAFQVPPRLIPQITAETWEGLAATARLAVRYYAARIAGN